MPVSFSRTPLYDHAVTVIDGFVYACAGSTEGKASLLLQDKVQCYNPHHDYWDFVAPMQEARAKSAAVEHDGLLYISGKNKIKDVNEIKQIHFQIQVPKMASNRNNQFLLVYIYFRWNHKWFPWQLV